MKTSSGDDVAASLQRLTAAHYDAHPFEFLSPADETAIESVQPLPFRQFVKDYARPAMKVAEIGCGPGRATMFLEARSLEVVAVDISERSLALARKRAPAAKFLRASNVALPLPSATFDLVISDGVIHHTPDARQSFLENVRILKPGGALYLGVYNPRGYYYLIYNFVGRPVRWMERSFVGRVLVYIFVFTPYYVIHLVRSRGKRSLRGTLNLFYDYIMTPRASFHSRGEIESWAHAAGLDIATYDPSLGNVHVFVMRKPIIATS